MYYILNETNQLIAADEAMLSLCGVAHIDALSSKIVKEDISLHLTEEGNIIIQTEEDEKTFPVTKISLSSLLGNLHLIHISTSDEGHDELSIATSVAEDAALIDSIIQDEKEVFPKEIEETITPLLSETAEDEITFGDTVNIVDDSTEANEIIEKEQTPPVTPTEDGESELFELLDDNNQHDDITLHETHKDETTEEAPIDIEVSDEKETSLQSQEEVDVAEINININEISQNIGISPDDYQNFLNEFIDTALVLEGDLQSSDNEKRVEATNTLSQLVEVLHLPLIGDIISDISHADETNKRHLIESFYSTLSRITTAHDTEETIAIEEDILEPKETLELFDTPESTEALTIQEEFTEKEISANPSLGTISLEGIKPKHFDFQLEEAANDLSLPVELIEEFVHDFIDQSHIETKKMLEAYENGDLDAIQKIGHLLKGASSNLRINALSDTLYKIQFCEDIGQIEMLIKDYWAHFLSFENQINMTSN